MRKKQKPTPLKRPPKSKTKIAGLAPGTLQYTGHRIDEPVQVHLMHYKDDFFEESVLDYIPDTVNEDAGNYYSWIHIDGIHKAELIEKAGALFQLHPLVLEDVTHNIQRPKMELYPNHMYIVMRCFAYDNNTRTLHNEQLSIILGSNFLLTFQEGPSELFDNVRERLRNGGPRLRKSGPDYLAYALIDAVVDSYFIILEKIGDDIESLEDLLLTNPAKDDIHKIHMLRRDLIVLRKSVWPLREMLSELHKNETGALSPTTVEFVKDVYDHTIQVMESVELYREMVIGLLDVYLSSLSNKMNEVMKVLTIITTIFIPFTFLAGVYGMNFTHFPELKMPWMYPWGFWSITIVMLGIMLWFFRRKKWL